MFKLIFDSCCLLGGI